MNPIRVQRKRAKGWRMPENTIFVGRPTKWGNPFKIGDTLKGEEIGCSNATPIELKQRWQVVLAYEFYLSNDVGDKNLKLLAKQELKGKNLACWCKEGEECHADILLKIANR